MWCSRPVPDLPAKSIFYYWNEDFLEGRRKGLQAFLDKWVLAFLLLRSRRRALTAVLPCLNRVVHMTVCLSDSQLHLFLQTQLSLAHIQDCVQGHTPFTVTDAILTYASSNQGFAQAQQEEPAKESELAVSYESTERCDSRTTVQTPGLDSSVSVFPPSQPGSSSAFPAGSRGQA